MFVDRAMKKFPNMQSALVVAIGLIIGLGLDHVVGGRPFKFVVLVVGLSICGVLFFLPQMWTRSWKMMRALSVLSLIIFLLTFFDGFVIGRISWMTIGFWGTIFVHSSYQWWALRLTRRRVL